MVSETRLYGAVIAVTSGIYSLWSASVAPQLTTGMIVMALVGVVVLVHGIVLVTALADQLANTSGPLMIGYSVIMILNQTLLGTGVLGMSGGSGMGMQEGMGPSQMTSGMGVDAGLVFLAVIMLASCIIMTRQQSMNPNRSQM
jgi:hypothetical protein